MTIQSRSVLQAYNKCTQLATRWSNILFSFIHKDDITEDATHVRIRKDTNTEISIKKEGGTTLTQEQLNAIASVVNKADKLQRQNLVLTQVGTPVTHYTTMFNINNNEEAVAHIDMAVNVTDCRVTLPTFTNELYAVLTVYVERELTDRKLKFIKSNVNDILINKTSSTDLTNHGIDLIKSESNKLSIYTVIIKGKIIRNKRVYVLTHELLSKISR